MWTTGERGMAGRRAADRAVDAAAFAVLGAAVVLFVLRPLSLTFPAEGLDASWIAVLGRAATLPARWGVDLAFTYGPASALVTRFYTDGYLAAALPASLGVAAAAALCALRLARIGADGRRFGGPAVAASAAVVAAGLAAELAQDQDSFYFALPLALLLLDILRAPEDRASRVALALGAALLGALALAKTSYGVAALGPLALADARAAWIRRRPPWLTGAALLGFLLAYAAYGQRLTDLPAYLDLQGQVAAGYGEAMYLPAPPRELLAYLAGSALSVGVAGWSCAIGPRARLDAATAALGAAFALAIGLKAGFVRADTHPQIAWSALGMVGLVAAVGPALRRSPAAAAAIGIASLAVLWLAAPLFLLADTDRDPHPANLPEIYRDMGAGLAAEAGAWGQYIRGPAAFAEAARRSEASAWAAVRAAQPLPALAGGVDIIPSEQNAVLANGLDYRPRPSFQDYSTYTAGLIAANAAFYRGPDAPDWVLVGGVGLDDRYPASTEGALWPELLSRYAPVRRAGPWLALERRAEPLPDVLGPPVRLEAALGRPFAVPDGAPSFARIAVHETLLGRLAATVFRPPALALRVRLAGGEERSFRFIPAIAAGGFLLSPLVDDADGFALLASGHGAEAGGPRVVEATVGGSAWARPFYGPTVSVELRPVDVPRAAPSADARPLYDELARALPWRRALHALGRDGDLDGDRLPASAPSTLALQLPAASRLHVGFGLADGAWTEGHTEGVCFAVRAPGGGDPLWRRCLDPAAVAADRGPQAADVVLPPGTAAVALETACRRSCAWGWAYWAGVEPGP